jgi:hypothetical protein
MKAKIKPTEKPGKLLKYLKPRLQKVEKKQDNTIHAEIQAETYLTKVPGIETFKINGETKEGLGGKPIHKEAFTKIETKKDAVKAFLATVEGYRLYVSTERDWDLKILRKYNPGIIKIEPEAAKELGIKELDEDFDLTQKEYTGIYQEFLTE